MTQKPTIDEVIEYAGHCRKRIMSDKELRQLPTEHQQEIEEQMFLRVCGAYPKIDAEKGWKSFVYKHCWGAAKDYLKSGNGFSESRTQKAAKKRFTDQGKTPQEAPDMLHRIEMLSIDGKEVDLDQVLGVHSVFTSEPLDTVKCDWDLIARMASIDKGIHCLALWIRGNTLETIGNGFDLSVQRIWAIIQEVIEKFDDPSLCVDPWTLQTIYAFGLCEVLGVHDVDQSTVFGIPLGQNLDPVDLDFIEPVDRETRQLDMFAI